MKCDKVSFIYKRVVRISAKIYRKINVYKYIYVEKCLKTNAALIHIGQQLWHQPQWKSGKSLHGMRHDRATAFINSALFSPQKCTII